MGLTLSPVHCASFYAKVISAKSFIIVNLNESNNNKDSQNHQSQPMKTCKLSCVVTKKTISLQLYWLKLTAKYQNRSKMFIKIKINLVYTVLHAFQHLLLHIIASMLSNYIHTSLLTHFDNNKSISKTSKIH